MSNDGQYFYASAQTGGGNLMAGGGAPLPPGVKGLNLSALGITDNPLTNFLAQQGSGWLMGQAGLTPAPFLPGENYAASIRNRQYYLEQQEAMRRAAGPDVQAGKEFIQGVAASFGLPMSPEVRDVANQFGSTVEPYLPMLAQAAPQQFDSFMGTAGSAIGLARGIHAAGRNRFDPTTGTMGYTGATAGYMAQDLNRALYGPDADPRDAMGLGGTEIGELYAAAQRRGLAGGSAETITAAEVKRHYRRPDAFRQLAQTDPGAIADLVQATKGKYEGFVKSMEADMGYGDATQRYDRFKKADARLQGLDHAFDDYSQSTRNAAIAMADRDPSILTQKASANATTAALLDAPAAYSYYTEKLAAQRPDAAAKVSGVVSAEDFRKVLEGDSDLANRYDKIRDDATTIELLEHTTASGISASSKANGRDVAANKTAVRAGLETLASTSSADFKRIKTDADLGNLGDREAIEKIASDDQLSEKFMNQVGENRQKGDWYGIWKKTESAAKTAFFRTGQTKNINAMHTSSQLAALEKDADATTAALENLDKTDPEKFSRLVAALQGDKMKKSLTNLTGAVAAMTDVLGSKGIAGASMETTIQAINNLTAGGTTATTGKKLENMVRLSANTADISGMGIDRYQLAVQQGIGLAQQQGLSGKFGWDVGQAASEAYAAASQSSSVGVANFNKDTPEAVAVARGQLTAQGINSQVGNNVGALFRAVQRADDSGDPDAASPALRRLTYAMTHDGRDQDGKKVDMSLLDRPDDVLQFLAANTDLGREGAALHLANRRANTAELQGDPDRQTPIVERQQADRLRTQSGLAEGGVVVALRESGRGNWRDPQLVSGIATELNRAIMGLGDYAMTEAEALDEKTRNVKAGQIFAARLGDDWDKLDPKQRAELIRMGGSVYDNQDNQMNLTGRGSLAQSTQQLGQEAITGQKRTRALARERGAEDSTFATTHRGSPGRRAAEEMRKIGRESGGAGGGDGALRNLKRGATALVGGVPQDEALEAVDGDEPDSKTGKAARKEFKNAIKSVAQGRIVRGPDPVAVPRDDDAATAKPTPSPRGSSKDQPLYVEPVGSSAADPISGKGR